MSGVLFLTWGYVDREDTTWHLDLAVLVLRIVVPLLFLVGLVGAYAKCRTHVGWLSVMGFVISFAGAGRGIIEGIRTAPDLYRQLGERSWVAQEGGIYLLLSTPVTWLLVGLSIVGLTTFRNEVLRNWGLLLLAMAFCGWVYQLTDDKTGIADLRSIHVAFGTLFSLSWVLLGYALWTSRNMVGRMSTRSL